VKNVHYVDTVGTSFLFRGERPLTGDGKDSLKYLQNIIVYLSPP
jgi:hypothetical protein